jgi:hypothetical protein
MPHTLTRALTVLGAAGALAAAPAASAKTRVHFQRIPGVKSAGTPARYDKVGILETGRKRAKNVLVLNPGTSASAAYFEPLARSIVARLPNWQVWAVERRENQLEDQSVFNRAKAGHASPQKVFDYYLGYLADPGITDHFQAIPDDQVTYAKRWGLKTEIGDLRLVVERAERLGGRVVVGGHSLGGSITTAYATWNFHGRPGADGLSGLVFIDGASFRDPLTAAGAREALAKLDQPTSSPWLTFGTFKAPLTGLFNTSGALGALTVPNQRSIAESSGLVPPFIRPPVSATNLGQYGYALDTQTSPPELIAAQAHLGRLAASGDPRGWVRAGELTPIKRYARMFAGWGLKGLDGTAWYHPERLTLDAGAIANGRRNPAQKVMHVRTTEGRHLPRDLKMYAFGAALGGRGVLTATRELARQSHIPRRNLVLVDRQTTYAHNDPNSAAPKRNAFLERLVPFLRRTG